MPSTTNISTTAATSAHDVIVRMSFELVGVSLMAIAADTNETLGTLLLILMLSFAFYFLMAHGATLIAKYTKPFAPNPHPPVTII